MSDDSATDVTLARAFVAAMQLRLPGTAGRIGRKMRYIDEIAPRLRAGGLVRDVPGVQPERLWSVGIASASNSVPAFGGVLYGAAALRQDVTVVAGKATPTYQDSQVDVADMTFTAVDNRLAWKEYALSFRLLEDLFESCELPDVILLDLPLLVSRSAQVAGLADEDVQDEWNELMESLVRFWGRYGARCFPSDPAGPMVAHIGRQHFGAVLAALRAEGARGSLDPISPDLASLVADDWGDLRRAGIDRVLRGLLRPGRRTAAYPYTALGREALRSAPRLLGEQGLLGFHMQAGYRTPIWQIESIGPTARWDAAALDRLAGLLIYLTLNDHPGARPLPLWYASRLVKVSDRLLHGYRSAMTQVLREQSVDQAWLEGVDELAPVGVQPETTTGGDNG